MCRSEHKYFTVALAQCTNSPPRALGHDSALRPPVRGTLPAAAPEALRLQAGTATAPQEESPPQEANKEMQNKREGCKVSRKGARHECRSEDSVGKVMLR